MCKTIFSDLVQKAFRKENPNKPTNKDKYTKKQFHSLTTFLRYLFQNDSLPLSLP